MTVIVNNPDEASSKLDREASRAGIKTQYSIPRAVRSILAGNWGRGGAENQSPEYATSKALESIFGPAAYNGVRLPNDALRDLTAGVVGDGGYLVPTFTKGYVDDLQPASVALKMGATVESAENAGHNVPSGDTSVVTEWLPDETTPITESSPTFVSINSTIKILGAYCEISRQLLLQSNAEAVLRRMLNRAAAAALDAAIINGSGASGQPMGIVGTTGIGTFTGTSLDQAALRNAQADVGNADAVLTPEAQGYVTTPTVAELLTTRARATGSDRMLWEGKSSDGTVEGCRAMSTTGCPAGTMIFGDWSAVTVLQFDGGLSIAVDPYSKFNTGLVGLRLLMPVDIIITHPAAFSVATSVT